MKKKKLKVLLEVLNNVSVKQLERAEYIEINMIEVREREKLSIEDVFYFVVFCLHNGCLCVMFYVFNSKINIF